MGTHNPNLKLIAADGKRLDGRTANQLRNIRIDVGVLEGAVGSAYVEWGDNKVIAGVYGPREVFPKFFAKADRAIVRTIYSMSTFASLEEHGRAGPNRRSNEISMVLAEAFENVVMIEKFPTKMIDTHITVLQAAAGTRIAAFLAGVAALIDGGFPMNDIAAGVSVGKADGALVVDLNKEEDNFGQADMPIVFSGSDDILLLQMDGKMTREEIKEGLDLTNEASKAIMGMIRKAVGAKYEGAISNKLNL
jgi:exosome complex component RRP41